VSRVWIWLWTIPACEGGDLDAIVAKAKEHRVGVMVKTSDGLATHGDWDPKHLSPDLLARLRDAGVPVRSWAYVYPTVDLAGQAEVVLRPATDAILDAEGEWDGHAAEAQQLVSDLLARKGTRLVGYAPLPIVSYHDGAGQYEEFNRLDLACPQAYAGTGGRDAIGALTWTQREWDRAFARCNIEPAVYAADQDPADLRAAIAFVRAQVRSFGADGDVSVWSWQHMTDEHWAVIDEFTKEDEMLSEADKTWLEEMVEGKVIAARDHIEARVAAQLSDGIEARFKALIGSSALSARPVTTGPSSAEPREPRDPS